MSIEKKEMLKLIKPEKDKASDKYSWLLYQRVKKNGIEDVYVSTWSAFDGHNPKRVESIDLGNTPSGLIMIGLMDGVFFHGNSLANIWTPRRPRNDWAFGPAHHTSEWVDVTDRFWSEYIEYGRCRFTKMAHDYELSDDGMSKTCRFCGDLRMKKVEIIPKEVITWETQSNES